MAHTKKYSSEVEKTYDSIIIEKAKYEYFETNDSGKMTVYFKSGLVYEFKGVKKPFAQVFMNSSDREIGTAFNKYINAHFVVDKIRKTKKFHQIMEKARKVDKSRKDKKRRTKNAELV